MHLLFRSSLQHHFDNGKSQRLNLCNKRISCSTVFCFDRRGILHSDEYHRKLRSTLFRKINLHFLFSTLKMCRTKQKKNGRHGKFLIFLFITRFSHYTNVPNKQLIFCNAIDIETVSEFLFPVHQKSGTMQKRLS